MNNHNKFPLFTTAYAPPIGYLAKAISMGGVCLEACENFEKQSFRNRMRILTDQGVRDLSIPIVHQAGDKIPIREVRSDDRQSWRRLHWRTLLSSYGASPFFGYYKDELEPLILNGAHNLFDLNLDILRWILSSIRADIRIEFTLEYRSLKSESDYRNIFHPKRPSPDNPPYVQAFSDRMPFAPGLSTFDLIFNLGPEAKNYLMDFGKELKAME